jgi:iron(III)-enterobactin esterase
MNISACVFPAVLVIAGLFVSCSDSGSGAATENTSSSGRGGGGASGTQAANAGATALPVSGSGGVPVAAGMIPGGGSDGIAGAGGSSGSAAQGGMAGVAGIGVSGTSGVGGSSGGGVVVSPVPDGKQTIRGPYTAPPEATRQAGVPPATLDHFVYNTSRVFPGTSRDVNIFIPAQYKAGTAVPFMVLQDGDEQLTSFKTNIVLENLIFQKRLPVMAAIFVDRPDNGPLRSLEYDCLDDDYSQFILNEIIPAVKSRHPELVLTDDPNGRGALGKSSGGPASFTLAWRHPESFRRVLTLNGSFVNLCKDGPGADTYPDLILKTDPAKPLRVYLFSGDNDLTGFAAGNQAMADALNAKGYAWRYVYGIGASHANNFAASLMTEALLWCWAGYPL